MKIDLDDCDNYKTNLKGIKYRHQYSSSVCLLSGVTHSCGTWSKAACSVCLAVVNFMLKLMLFVDIASSFEGFDYQC